MPLFRYLFAAGALDRLAAHHVAWQAVLFVLEVASPVHQQHIGSAVLRVTGADQRGHLLMVTLLELPDTDDTYEILSARYLDPEESAAASFLLTPREDQ